MRTLLVAAILFLCVSPAFGQTASELETKYGKPIMTYVVSEHIWMTPEYTADGQVCRMRLYPKRIAPEANYLSPRLPFEELKGVLNQLIPLQTRGAKKNPFSSGAAGGRAEWMTYQYENVRLTFVSSFAVDPASWKERKSYTFTTETDPSQQRPANAGPSEDDFSPNQASNTEIVTITWNDKTCAGK